MGAGFQAFHTALVFGVIIAVIVWAFWPKNKEKFDRRAESIFDEDKDLAKRKKQESDNDE